jgi:hypothetical protein
VRGASVVLRCCRKAVRVEGPLALYASGFGAHLVGQGYAPSSAEDQLRLMAHLSRWLAEQRTGPAALTPEAVERFRDARRAGCARLTGRRALGPLLGYLGGLGLDRQRCTPWLRPPASRPDGPAETSSPPGTLTGTPSSPHEPLRVRETDGVSRKTSPMKCRVKGRQTDTHRADVQTDAGVPSVRRRLLNRTRRSGVADVRDVGVPELRKSSRRLLGRRQGRSHLPRSGAPHVDGGRRRGSGF